MHWQARSAIWRWAAHPSSTLLDRDDVEAGGIEDGSTRLGSSTHIVTQTGKARDRIGQFDLGGAIVNRTTGGHEPDASGATRTGVGMAARAGALITRHAQQRNDENDRRGVNFYRADAEIPAESFGQTPRLAC